MSPWFIEEPNDLTVDAIGGGGGVEEEVPPTVWFRALVREPNTAYCFVI